MLHLMHELLRRLTIPLQHTATNRDKATCSPASFQPKAVRTFIATDPFLFKEIDEATSGEMAEKSLNVTIVSHPCSLHLFFLSPAQQVGGSLSGLFQGVVLKRLGHNVRILERASPDGLREQGAGITAREDIQEYLNTYDRFSDQPYSPGDANIQFINQTGEVTKTWKMQLRMTSWDTLYYRLRANFDGLQSEYVNTARSTPQTGEGAASYEYECNVTDVKYQKGSVDVHFERSTGVCSTQRLPEP